MDRKAARAMILPLALAQFICSYAATNMNVAYGFGVSRADFTIGGTVVIPKGSISPVWIFVAIGALVGAVLVASVRPAGQPFGIAMIMMLVFSLIGLVLGVFIPRRGAGTEQPAESTTAGAL